MPPAAAEVFHGELLRTLEEFFLQHPRAVVMEEGRVAFDMAAAHYSLTAQNGRCLLHLWSEERSLVRIVCGLRERNGTLRIEGRRFGQTRPQVFEISPGGDRCLPSTRNAERAKYRYLLERVLTREFPGWSLESMRTAPDLEHSFGPAYARGMLRRGQIAWAIIAINSSETQQAVDGILTLGILWLAQCREHAGGKRLFEGLRIIVPAGMFATVQARMAWLNTSAAKYSLCELSERTEELMEVDCSRSGNLHLKLAHAFDPKSAMDRCRKALNHVLALLDPGLKALTETRANGPAEVSLALYGLEFARIRRQASVNAFSHREVITFGAGANETPLTAENEEFFSDLTRRLFENRHAGGTMRNPLYRLQPERWLESMLRADIGEIEPTIRGDIVYTQVPAFSAGDRGMLDLLTVTNAGRLAVIEIKADDDLHLPLQALDYWCRVRQLHCEGAFQRYGYFRGIELSDKAPLLFLIAPALRIHPATDTVLRHLSPEIPWELIGLNEDWRVRRKVILRKRSEGWAASLPPSTVML